MFKLKFFLIYVSLLFVNVRCDGELIILHSPSSLKFNYTNDLYFSNLENLLSACLGYTINEDSNWQGLELSGLSFPKALIMIEIPGVELDSKFQNKIKLITDDYVPHDIYEKLYYKTKKRYPELKNMMSKISLDSKKISIDSQEYELGDWDSDNLPPVLTLEHLHAGDEIDNKFIQEINKLESASILNKLFERKNVVISPDILWIILPSLHNLMQYHSSRNDVESIFEAKKLLENALDYLTNKVKKVHDDQVLITAMIYSQSDEGKSYSRFKRAVSSYDDLTLEKLNVAEDYDENFPVIFNIILWFGLAILFSILAICMVIANMDPGRDSIIYRMTSQRMKKDN